jgi:multicomponent Na+:H+ antiporter subunit B
VNASLILRTACRYLLPLLLLVSVYLLVRGHHEPGGGFAAGLIAAASLTLYMLSLSVAAARGVMTFSPLRLMAAGLAAIFIAAAWGPVTGHAMLEARWWQLDVPLVGITDLGTPQLFDVGVALATCGAMLAMVLSLERHEEEP